MPSQKTQDTTIDFVSQLIARAGARDRTNLERQLTALDAELLPAKAQVWRRLLGKLGSLVPLPPITTGLHVVQFFRPDGKYRQQVFALEDAGNGLFHLFLPDVFSLAIDRKIIKAGVNGQYQFGKSAQSLSIDLMDNRSIDPPAHVKHMTGWNRKALRVTLDGTEPGDGRIEVAEALCDLAASQWADKAPA